MALDSGAPAASWAISDATGVRPEYLWPCLWVESGLDPTKPNLAGYPYYGINQTAGTYLAKLGISPSDYLTWPASRQLTTVMLPQLRSSVATYGPLASGTRVYQSNFYPASLATARALSSLIVWRPSSAYTANAPLDVMKKGAISVGDLAYWVRRAAGQSSVAAAIAASYAARPSAGPPRDPVYGTDFFDPLLPFAAVAGILGWRAARR